MALKKLQELIQKWRTLNSKGENKTEGLILRLAAPRFWLTKSLIIFTPHNLKEHISSALHTRQRVHMVILASINLEDISYFSQL